MKLIALTGLAAVEKNQLARALAAYWQAQGQQVVILDNAARLAIDPVRADGLPDGVAVIRREGDVLPKLREMLRTLPGDPEVVLFAVSETASPEAVFVTLDNLRGEVDLLTIALIDTRTCDCFPHIRADLEQTADLVVNLTDEESVLTGALLNQIENEFSGRTRGSAPTRSDVSGNNP